MEVESLYEKLIFTTVRIESNLVNNSISTGTGFLFDYKRNNKDFLFIVTNKHVIKDSIKGKLTFNLSDGKNPILGKHHTIEVSDFEKLWIGHEEKDIDIAIMPFGPVLHQLSEKKVQIFFKSIPSDLIPDETKLKEIDAIEDVIFIGYPNNIYNPINLLPIVRKGLTATPVSINFENRPKFLIDASIFPGSSGSPVFLCNVGSYSIKGKGLNVGSRIFFLGLIASGFIRNEINNIQIIDVPTGNIPIVKTQQMIDLGIVYKSIEINNMIELFLKSIKAI